MTKAEFRAKIKGIKPRVHLHPLPVCAPGKHDESCASKGLEVTCNKVKFFAVCVHIAKG